VCLVHMPTDMCVCVCESDIDRESEDGGAGRRGESRESAHARVGRSKRESV